MIIYCLAHILYVVFTYYYSHNGGLRRHEGHRHSVNSRISPQSYELTTSCTVPNLSIFFRNEA